MKKKSSVIVASIAVVVPLVAAIHMRNVLGSEPPGRLVDNHDGTVTDTITKLIWQQTTNGSTNLPNHASTCINTFGVPNLPAGSGWRLPTIKELISIVDYESPTTPLIDTAIFPDILTASYHRYYTSDTTTVTGGNAGNEVNFDTGVIESTNPGNGWVSRCVHNPMTDGGVP